MPHQQLVNKAFGVESDGERFRRLEAIMSPSHPDDRGMLAVLEEHKLEFGVSHEAIAGFAHWMVRVIMAGLYGALIGVIALITLEVAMASGVSENVGQAVAVLFAGLSAAFIWVLVHPWMSKHL